MVLLSTEVAQVPDKTAQAQVQLAVVLYSVPQEADRVVALHLAIPLHQAGPEVVISLIQLVQVVQVEPAGAQELPVHHAAALA